VSLDSLLTQTVTIVRAGTATSRYGDTAKDWTTSTSTTTRGWISQRGSDEDPANREAEIGTWVLFVGPDETITGRDRVIWNGTTFEVVGPPTLAYTPRGLHHHEVTLRVVDG